MVNRIRDLRQERGWTQRDLAERLNSKQQTIGNYENDQRGIDVETICRLCDIFGCTADYLLCRSENPLPVISDEDAALLRAYHAATPRDRELVDRILDAYREEAAPGSSSDAPAPAAASGGQGAG